MQRHLPQTNPQISMPQDQIPSCGDQQVTQNAAKTKFCATPALLSMWLLSVLHKVHQSRSNAQ
jgi:hypothetical protein